MTQRSAAANAAVETFLRIATAWERADDAPEPEPPDPKSAVSDFIFSTELEGRDGDIIDQGSWRLDEWRANPVILDSHYGDVIGRGLSAEVVEVKRRGKVSRELRGSIEWDLDSPRGAIVGGQHLRGFRKAVSVRWSPGKVTARADLPEEHPAFQKARKIRTPWGEELYSGRYMEQCTLLEVSSVGVPGDPRALQLRGAPLDATSAPEPLDLRAALATPEARALVAEHLRELLQSDPDVARLLRAFALSELSPVAPLSAIDYGEALASRLVFR